MKAKTISHKVRSFTPQIGDVIRVRYHDGDQSVIGLEGEVITDPDLDSPPCWIDVRFSNGVVESVRGVEVVIVKKVQGNQYK